MSAQLPTPQRSKSTIPVRNLWLLLLYASDFYKDAGEGAYSLEGNIEQLPALLAQILCQRTEQRLQRNLSQQYQPRQATLSRVRGRIDHIKTHRQQLLAQGKIACQFDQLSLNTPRNAFLRAALSHLATLNPPRKLRQHCQQLARQLQQLGITAPCPDRQQISRETFGRHDADDRSLLALARLAFSLQLPQQQQGKLQLPSLDYSDTELRRLFEKAVAGFYRHHLQGSHWQVFTGRRRRWPISEQSPGMAAILPGMITDIELESPDQRIIIDTKFNSLLISGYYRDSSIRSGYLYQIYSYLRAQEAPDDPRSLTAQGVLLHPSTGTSIDEYAVINQHPIRVITVDLNSDPATMKQQLSQILP